MSRDGKCPDIYECRMGLRSEMRFVIEIQRLKNRISDLKDKNKQLRYQKENIKHLYFRLKRENKKLRKKLK